MFKSKKAQTIRGWIICTGPDHLGLERQAEDLLTNDKFLGFKYHDHAGAFFFHPAQTPANKQLKLEPKMEKAKEYPEAQPIMYFIIYERKAGSFMPIIHGEAFKPVCLEKCDHFIVESKMDLENVSKDSIQNKISDGLSPITDEEEGQVTLNYEIFSLIIWSNEERPI